MNLALVTAPRTSSDAAVVAAGPASGLRAFGWTATDLPDGLTPQDFARIFETIAAGRAASTRKTYASTFRRFDRRRADRGIPTLPASPATVSAYLTDMATLGFAAGTIEGASAAIGAAHETEGHDNPTADPTVGAVRRGIRRNLGTAPRRQSRPLDTADIRRMLDAIDRSDPRGKRDAAIIVLGFASALRRSEIAALDLADIEPKHEGLLVRIRRSKTDPEAHGQLVGVAHGKHVETKPVAALDYCGRQPGQLFKGFRHDRIGPRPFTGSGLARMLKERAAAAGIPSERVRGHSCAPATPPPPPWPASASTASPPRPATPASRPWSSITSGPSKPCRSLSGRSTPEGPAPCMQPGSAPRADPPARPRARPRCCGRGHLVGRPDRR